MAAYNEQDKPHGYHVEDDDNLKEENLKKTFLSGEVKDADKPGMEAEGYGGHNFGEDAHTPSGDDKNNPSQNAGYTNAYLSRDEPSDEKTDKVNFKSDDQDGQPDYTGQRHSDDTTPGNEGGND